MSDLSIIIVNFNTPQLVYDCIASIQEWLTVPYQLIVVDNGSTEAVSPVRLPPDTEYVSLPKNKGFGAGNNAGANVATGTYLWLLNSDTLLVDRSATCLLNVLATHPEVGIASPYLFKGEHLQPDFYASFQSLRTLLSRSPRPKLETKAPFQVVDLVVGAALMIRRSLFEHLNGFDEGYFMYMEDDDLCMRAKKNGFQTVLVPAASVLHLQGQSIAASKTRKSYYYASQSRFWKKHYGTAATVLMQTLRLPYRIIRNGH